MIDPQTIAALGGGPDPTAAPDLPDAGSSVTSAQRGDPTDDLRHAIMFVQSYMEQEQDDEDLAAASKILSDLQRLLADQQKLADKATGAGAGARLVRKVTARAGY